VVKSPIIEEPKIEPQPVQVKEDEPLVFARRSREQSAENMVGLTREDNFVLERNIGNSSKGMTGINETQEVDLSTMNCLYIEDQVDSQILFKVQMKELKSIKFAVSFEEALPLLMSNKFDFIIMDINLQGEYNGLDALKMIHQMPGFEKMPIVAVTAYVLPGDREKFIAAGFNDFISKPIFREKMIETLNKVLI
jgi:CheY-like chemotaxis protein